MRKSLFILFVLGAFIFYPYAGAGQEKEKAKIVVIDPDEPNTNLIYDFPLWLYNHGYVSFYDSNWRGNYYGRRGAIVVRKPLSFGESFLSGFSKAFSNSANYYYRKKEQERDIKTTMALIKLKWASEGYRPKFNQPQRARPLPEYRMSPEERQANRERIIELDRIIKLKKERANLDKLFREAGWLDKDRIEYLDKYYPLPKEEQNKRDSRPIPEGHELVRPKEKEEDDIVKFARSQGAMLPGEYKMKKLNEYLKSQNLPEVPLAFEVDELFHGGWVIYWDGEKWARKKK